MEQKQINLGLILEELNSLKKDMSEIKSVMADELEFSKRVDEAWAEYDEGEFVKMKKEEFLKELEKW
jgi:hypothetical protein